MKEIFLINILLFNSSFFQIMIYISNFLFKESLSSCNINSNNLTNIINAGPEYFRYLNFANYSNGDMVFLSNSFKQNDIIQNIRIFYGLTKKGRPLFNDSYFYSTNVNENNIENGKYESVSLVVKESGDNKNEYLMSFSKSNTFAEIYNFENGTIYRKPIHDFVNNANSEPNSNNTIKSYRHEFISLFSNDCNYFYLLGFINDQNKFIIQKHLFNSLKDFANETTLNKSIQINHINAKNLSGFDESGLSCFQTEKEFIICFFLNESSNYLIVAYNPNLEEINNVSLNSNIDTVNNVFYKCIHLKGEIGVFSYYEGYFPVLLLKEFNNYKFKNYTIPEIIINQIIDHKLNDNLQLNDIIKFTENKIYYCCTESFKNNIYIISIYLYNNKYKIRYYLIEITKYGKKYHIYYDMRMHKYNNFLAFGFSHEDYHSFFSSLLIFSYPNGTDYNLDLIQNFLKHSNISEIYINLKNYTRIENNIFGYIYSGIIINELNNCDNLNLISSSSNKIITPNYILKEDEIIKLDFKNNYNKFNCNIQYSLKAKPDLECYDRYPKYLDGDNITNEEFNTINEEYIGRLSYYNITLNESLTTECEDLNCELCLQNNTCLTYKNNDPFLSDSQTKNYLDQVIMIGDIEIIRRELKENKEDFVNNINDFIKSIDINKNYEMKGDDYTVMIRPTNSSPILSSTHVDFESCEKILRDHYNISNSRIIIFLLLEINNLDSQSLVNQVGYQAFDDKQKSLNLSLCNNTNIKIFYLIKSNSSIDISFISSVQDSNIDLFNLDNGFFTDICFSYSYSENDVVLEDRIKDFYQNYSVCDDGCTYNDINIEYMTITCDCEVKTNLTTTQKVINLKQIKDVDKSSIFEIIRCYNLVFSFKNKSNNAGFWIFLILIIAHIPLLIIYFYYGLKPIKSYLVKEMIKYGYISKKNAKKIFLKDNNNKEESNKNSEEKSENNLRLKRTKNKLDKMNSPPKNNKKDKNKMISLINKKIDLIDSSSTNKIKVQGNKVLDELNNIVSGNEKPSSKVIIKDSKKYGKNKLGKVKKKKILIKKIKYKNKNKNSSNASTEEDIQNENQDNYNNNIINLSLININVNNPNSFKITGSNHVLNIYTFEEAIKYDKRSLLRIYYIYLLAKQAIFHAFLFKSPLELFPLRFCLLIFIISSDLALNALFYFDDKISEKYRYTKGLLLFAFSNNITVILLSTVIGFILLTLFTKLSNSTNEIRKVFREEEKKIKNNKKYVVTENRKIEIFKEIELILKRYKIKVIIFIVIELILMLFFWYYVTAFCHVYPSTQKSWLWDSFLSILSRIIMDLLFCLGFAKLYRIGVESNINCLYKISIFFYSFS